MLTYPADPGLGWLMVLLGLMALVGAGFFFFEAWALLSGHVPITGYVRLLTLQQPKLIVAAVAMTFLGLGILLGHFWT